MLERSIPATAIIFTEPEIPSPRRRQDSFKVPQKTHASCPRPKLPIGPTLNDANQKFSPLLNKIPEQIASLHSKFSALKAKVLDTLGLQCLLPILLHPFAPILKYVRCLLDLNYNDGFMVVPGCNSTICTPLDVEEREITHRLEIPHMDTEDLSVRTMDRCFRKMQPVAYGTRVLVTLVDDQPCDDPKYQDECKELMEEDRIVMEENCETPGSVLMTLSYILNYFFNNKDFK